MDTNHRASPPYLTTISKNAMKQTGKPIFPANHLGTQEDRLEGRSGWYSSVAIIHQQLS